MKGTFIFIIILILIIYIYNFLVNRLMRAEYKSASKKWEGIVKELSRRK